MDDEYNERMRNLLIYGTPATDKELRYVFISGPGGCGCLILLICAIFVLYTMS